MTVKDEYALNESYKEALREWIVRTGMLQQDLAELTEPFDFSLGKKKLNKSTFSRTIAERPQKMPGLHNLYRILGVLYALNVVDETAIGEFLCRMELSEPSNGDTWDGIWNGITKAAPIVRQNAQEFRRYPEFQQTSKRLNWLHGTYITLAIVCICVIGLTILVFSQSQHSASCLEPVPWSPPNFKRAEGISVYLPELSNPESTILMPNVRAIAHDASGIWVGYVPNGTFDGVSKLIRDTKTWQHCPGLGITLNQNVNAFITFQDALFVATDGKGVGRLDRNTWYEFSKGNGLSSDAAYDFLQDYEGNLYVATLDGVFRYSDERWNSAYQATNGGLASNHVSKLFDDAAGNRWFGTIDQGISRLSPDGTWASYYRTDPGLRYIRAIESDNDGNVWFGTDGGGLLKFSNEEWQVYSVETGYLASNSVQDVEYDSRYDRLWIATPTGALYTSDGGTTWTTFISRNTWSISIGCPHDCAYNDNHIWFVFRDGGIGHSQLPPSHQTVKVLDTPKRVQLSPNEEYIFSVDVQVLSEDLADGDGLFAIESDGADLFGAWERIPIPSDVTVEPGQHWTFTNVQNPIIAPQTPGIYQLKWRIWQNGRYVSETIVVEFEVVST